MVRISFLRKSLKEFRVLDCLASSGKLLQRYRIDGKKESLIDFFLLVLFDRYVHFLNCI